MTLMQDNSMVSNFASILRRLLQDRDISASQLSKATGIPKNTISEWISDRGREPRCNPAIVKLARFLGVSVEYLITGENIEEHLVKEVFKNSTDEFVSIHKGVYRVTLEKFKGKKT